MDLECNKSKKKKSELVIMIDQVTDPQNTARHGRPSPRAIELRPAADACPQALGGAGSASHWLAGAAREGRGST